MAKRGSSHHATAFVVFGATGDLTQNKLYPALYELSRRHLLPEKFYLYGIARESLDDKAFKNQVRKNISAYTDELEKNAIDRLLRRARYIRADLNERDGYDKLEEMVRNDERRVGHGIMRIFYLALPPSLFNDVIDNVETCQLGKALCTKEHLLSRVIVEKPFGHNVRSAKKLDQKLTSAFKKPQIYRIDHYLGKEPFQNIMALRFANAYFEHHWSSKYIREIQINALETVGLEGRYAYYDGAGALRDMVQSHLMQVLAVLTMSEPSGFSAERLQQAKAKLISSVRPYDGKAAVVRGQYRGYKQEKGIPDNTSTETYAAIKLEVENARWKGVPVYMRTGKKLSRKETSISIVFKGETDFFSQVSGRSPATNLMTIQVAPTPSVTMRMNVQAPGFQLKTEPATMHYCRGEHTEKKPVGDYERLILDVIHGDQKLFTGSKEVLASWKALDPFLSREDDAPVLYAKGSNGPKEADRMLKKAGTEWLDPITNCPYE